MNVLAIIPDGNILNKIKLIAKYNPEIEWELICIRSDCIGADFSWAKSHVCIDDSSRIVVKTKPEQRQVINSQYTVFEKGCIDIIEPLLGLWFDFDVKELHESIWNLSCRLDDYDPDVVVLWGDRCWYNEIVKEWAANKNKQLCFLERATFPGTIIADSTGLEQGNCDLAAYGEKRKTVLNQLQSWKMAASLQSLEKQPEISDYVLSRMIGNDNAITFVPMQVPYDTNMIYRSCKINTNSKLLDYVYKCGYENVVVKKHPGDEFTCDAKLRDKCDQYGFKLVDASIHSLLSRTFRVVSINSQVIVEAWIHDINDVEILGKPAFDLPYISDTDIKLSILMDYFIDPCKLYERISSFE